MDAAPLGRGAPPGRNRLELVFSVTMNPPSTVPPFEIIDFDALPATDCPCGTARRALTDAPDLPLTLHVTEIDTDARLHYHRRLTEIYYFLQCEPGAQMQLDHQRVDVRPGMAIVVRPGTRHRAVGRMKVAIVVYPKFDPADEWFDDEPASDGGSANV